MLDILSLKKKIALKFSYTEKLNLMFIIHRFRVCDFVYLLNFICNGKYMALWWSCAEWKKIWTKHVCSQLDSAHTAKECPFCYLVKPFPHFVLFVDFIV